MKQIAKSELIKMDTQQFKDALPFQVTSNGEVIGVFTDGKPQVIEKIIEKPVAGRTQCPNCKMVYTVTPPDGKLPFLSGIHPKN